MRTTLKALFLSTALGALAFPALAEDLVVGLATAQTGGFAPYDQPSLKGLQMAVDEINAGGGIAGKFPIKLIAKDTRSDAAQTALVAQELVDEGISILITPCDADPSIAAGQISQAAQIPAFSFCATTPTMPLAVGDYMFGNYPADNVQAAVLAQRQRHVVDAAHRVEQRGVLEDHRAFLPHGVHLLLVEPRNVLAVEPDLAGIWREQADQLLDEHALTDA